VDTVHECDRQTDRQTDGRTDRITITDTVQTASHGKNCTVVVFITLQSCKLHESTLISRCITGPPTIRNRKWSFIAQILHFPVPHFQDLQIPPSEFWSCIGRPFSGPAFHRAMPRRTRHCYGKSSLVCLSVCNIEVSWSVVTQVGILRK